MAITTASNITNLDTYIGDTSTDRISTAERLQAITEGTTWLQEELADDLQNKTFTLEYFDGVYDYKVTTDIADLLEGADLRRDTLDQNLSFTHKSSRELAEEIGQRATESSWAIERRDSNNFLKINHGSKYSAQIIADFESLTSNGTWALDAVNADGINLTLDSIEFKQGSGSFNFDADVSQSGNNLITLSAADITSLDLTDSEDLTSWFMWVYVPDVTNFTSVTLYWGSDSSNYWSATVTTDFGGSSFVNGWNRIKINWADATKTSSPDVSAIDYIRIDLNYGAGQGDDTDFRIDDLRLVRPEKLTFHYISWHVGEDTNGTDIFVFGATTDVPYYSGRYDQYKYAVAHKAASVVFTALRLPREAEKEEIEAIKALRRYRKLIPSSRAPEIKNFKIRGVRFNRNRD